MRVGFLIGALTYYKLFGPIIEEALRDGLEVVLLLRDPVELRRGLKSYLRPDPATVPSFAAGSVEIRQWDSNESLRAICERERIQVVVSIWVYPRDVELVRLLRAQGIRWVALQLRIEPFVMPPEGLLEPDVTCVFSQFWADYAMSRVQSPSSEELRSRVAVTGFPEMDPLQGMDRRALRARYGIPLDRPVVVWMPHDYHAFDPWEMLVFRRHWYRHPRLVWRALTERDRWKNRKNQDLVLKLVSGATHRQLARSLRAFCDRNKAFLVVKSREKDYWTKADQTLDREVADLFTFDRTYHPPTSLEVLAVADLLVHVFSVAALEAATCGVPALCLVPPPESEFLEQSHTWKRVPHELLHGPETVWNFPGVSSAMTIDEAARRLPEMSLRAFPIDEGRRAEYLDRFVGPSDGRSARRVLEVIARRVAEVVG